MIVIGQRVKVIGAYGRNVVGIGKVLHISGSGHTAYVEINHGGGWYYVDRLCPQEQKERCITCDCITTNITKYGICGHNVYLCCECKASEDTTYALTGTYVCGKCGVKQ